MVGIWLSGRLADRLDRRVWGFPRPRTEIAYQPVLTRIPVGRIWNHGRHSGHRVRWTPREEQGCPKYSGSPSKWTQPAAVLRKLSGCGAARPEQWARAGHVVCPQ